MYICIHTYTSIDMYMYMICTRMQHATVARQVAAVTACGQGDWSPYTHTIDSINYSYHQSLVISYYHI